MSKRLQKFVIYPILHAIGLFISLIFAYNSYKEWMRYIVGIPISFEIKTNIKSTFPWAILLFITVYLGIVLLRNRKIGYLSFRWYLVLFSLQTIIINIFFYYREKDILLIQNLSLLYLVFILLLTQKSMSILGFLWNVVRRFIFILISELLDRKTVVFILWVVPISIIGLIGFFNLIKIEEPKENKNLVGYWKFDGDAQDLSGNNNHGKWIGKEEYRDGGVFGKAAYFDGMSNYVLVPHSPSIDVGQGAFSFGAWVNSTGKSNNKNQHFLNKRTGGKGLFWGIYLSATSANINVEMASNSIDDPKSNIKLDNWHHIFLTRDSSGLTTLYIDWKPIASKNIHGDTSNTHSFNIGGLEGFLDQGFHGLIDEVVIYNRVISQREIYNLAKKIDEDISISLQTQELFLSRLSRLLYIIGLPISFNEYGN